MVESLLSHLHPKPIKKTDMKKKKENTNCVIFTYVSITIA